jgi:hypothetical protein
MKPRFISFAICCLAFITPSFGQVNTKAWIRINQLGYIPDGIKIAVLCSKDSQLIKTFQLVDAATKKFVYSASSGKMFGAYGPFKQTYRLNFSSFKKAGRYYVQAGEQSHLNLK